MSTEKRADLNLRIARLPIVDQCEGCQRIVEDAGAKVCGKYAEPAFHWEDGQICLMATHIKKEVTIVKKAVNPLKASKRAAGKKK
ncbi:MAG TPA: PxxKW family cysteine-rich protein [bacterium]|nr:PxxKW family cysteine-rich protein [bacterium]